MGSNTDKLTAPITLITGKPGAGKSTFIIDKYEQVRVEQNRPIYYYNIDGVTLDWTYFDDPEKWHELPAKSIVIIDEAQDVFPPLKPGGKKPDHYQLLARVRKMGISLVICTQHPSLIDAFLRRLVQVHVHLKRVAGFEKSAIYESLKGVIDVDKDTKRHKAGFYKFPPHTYKQHKSAEAHTIKKVIPKRLIVIPLVLIAAGVCAWYAYGAFSTEALPEISENLNPASAISRAAGTDKDKSQPPPPRPNNDKKYNVVQYGRLEGAELFITTELNGQLYFELAGVHVSERAIERMGYQVVPMDECLALVGDFAITCKPATTNNQLLSDEENAPRGGGAERAEGFRASPRADVSDSYQGNSSDTPVSAFHTNLMSQPLSITKISWSVTD